MWKERREKRFYACLISVCVHIYKIFILKPPTHHLIKKICNVFTWSVNYHGVNERHLPLICNWNLASTWNVIHTCVVRTMASMFFFAVRLGKADTTDKHSSTWTNTNYGWPVMTEGVKWTTHTSVGPIFYMELVRKMKCSVAYVNNCCVCVWIPLTYIKSTAARNSYIYSPIEKEKTGLVFLNNVLFIILQGYPLCTVMKWLKYCWLRVKH